VTPGQRVVWNAPSEKVKKKLRWWGKRRVRQDGIVFPGTYLARISQRWEPFDPY